MGRYKQGILGAFSGKVGNVVGSSINGIDYMKGLPRKSTKTPTLPQLMQRSRFGLMADFLRTLGGVVKVGFQSRKKGLTPYNAASSYNLEHAITGTYPNFVVDYPEVVYSRGNLLGLSDQEVAAAVAGELDFSWSNDAPVGGSGGTDKATIVVYNPAKDKYVVAQAAAARSAETSTVELPADFSAHRALGYSGR
ncbi:DUF6266 family protein [Pedobacter psychroterrae]|uniref:Uncharacterized protein n=1 Tax=Pedobacter psychroterrae TaxID=2530453 RepID=A0A4V2MLQ1_9SPHI|nr:DUF6266 family protein [Pedobacter psychroterrae]TCD02947.1 hypothetical protein EZ437_02895 [Pedobacter psychroterrae]